MDYINIILSEFQSLNQILITDYDDVKAYNIIILSKSQSSNQIMFANYAKLSCPNSV